MERCRRLSGRRKAFRRGTFSDAVTNNWPPFFSLVAVPISWLSALPPQWGRVLWALITSGAFAVAVAVWWRETRPPGNPDRVAPLAVLATMGFWLHHVHYQQVYGIVFAATAVGFLDAERGRDIRAGIWIGVAASAKATPAFTLFHFLFARRFRTVAAAVVAAALCSLSTALVLGPRGAIDAHRVFLSRALSLRGTHGTQNQSVLALVERFTTGETVPERGGLAPLVRLPQPAADAIGKALSLVLIAAVGFSLAGRRERPAQAFAPLVCAAVLAGSYC